MVIKCPYIGNAALLSYFTLQAAVKMTVVHGREHEIYNRGTFLDLLELEKLNEV